MVRFHLTDIRNAYKDNKICSLIGVEGGHSISSSLAVLRMFYMLGVRYLTLTSTCHTPWADSSFADAPKFDVKHNGLTDFGKVRESDFNTTTLTILVCFRPFFFSLSLFSRIACHLLTAKSIVEMFDIHVVFSMSPFFFSLFFFVSSLFLLPFSL